MIPDSSPNFTGKSIVDVFDISNNVHIKEYIFLQQNYHFKNDSIFINCEFPPQWQISLAGKLANGYITLWTRLK